MEPDVADAPACHLLGLETDRRTHFTFPQPDHRCHAGQRPQRIEVAHQAAYCLTDGFDACARYRARDAAGATTMLMPVTADRAVGSSG